MSSYSRVFVYCSRAAAGLASALLLAACGVTATAPAADRAPPPPPPADLTPLPTDDLTPVEQTAAAPAKDDAERLLFPGLDDADEPGLPFERGVAERRKRIDLGLEPTRQADEPVNNVIDLEF